MKEIENLLPHRTPFLYVDQILSADQQQVVGLTTFDPSNSFFQSCFPNVEHVPGTILIEAMAQCGGAGLRKLGMCKELFGLARIETARFLKEVTYKKTVKMVIKNVRLSNKFIKQSGIAYVDGTVVAEASWLCAKL
jgi:3-hydroxyacyl-[acyl-carrier-protein] dehydratase